MIFIRYTDIIPATNYPDEAISELWSEYRNNPTPRPLAKAVGNAIMKHARKSL